MQSDDLRKQLHFVPPACQDFYKQIISQQSSDMAGEVHNDGNNAGIEEDVDDTISD